MRKNFELMIRTGNFSRAITILSSDRELQTTPNILACCKSPDAAFCLLRFVPHSRDIQDVIDLASKNVRYARIIFEDFPTARSRKLFVAATNGAPEIAAMYQRKFGLPKSWASIARQSTPGIDRPSIEVL